MLPLPADLRTCFEIELSTNCVPQKTRPFYLQWLRFYLDYCSKYKVPSHQQESLPLFLQKLHEKKVAPWQEGQASQAVSLYYRLVSGPEPWTGTKQPASSTGASWQAEFAGLNKREK